MKRVYRREVFILRVGFVFMLLGGVGFLFAIAGIAGFSQPDDDHIFGAVLVFFGSLFFILGIRTVGLYLSRGKEMVRGFLYATNDAKGTSRQHTSSGSSRLVLAVLGMVLILSSVSAGLSYIGGVLLGFDYLGVIAFFVLLYILPRVLHTPLLGDNYWAMRAHIAEERKNAEASQRTSGEAKGSFLIPIKKAMTKSPATVFKSTGEVRYRVRRDRVGTTRFVTIEDEENTNAKVTLIKSLGGTTIDIQDIDQKLVAKVELKPGEKDRLTIRHAHADVWRKRVFSRHVRISQGGILLLEATPMKLDGKRVMKVDHYDGDELQLIAIAYGLLFGLML